MLEKFVYTISLKVVEGFFMKLAILTSYDMGKVFKVMGSKVVKVT